MGGKRNKIEEEIKIATNLINGFKGIYGRLK